MWSQVIIPILTMVIGLIGGAAAMDMFKTNDRMDRIERKLQKIERRMKNEG